MSDDDTSSYSYSSSYSASATREGREEGEEEGEDESRTTEGESSGTRSSDSTADSCEEDYEEGEPAEEASAPPSGSSSLSCTARSSSHSPTASSEAQHLLVPAVCATPPLVTGPVQGRDGPKRAVAEHARDEEIRRRQVVSRNVRRPGAPPATRLPPTTVPYAERKKKMKKKNRTQQQQQQHSVTTRRLPHPTGIRAEHVDPHTVLLRWPSPRDLPSWAPKQQLRYKVLLSDNGGAGFKRVAGVQGRRCVLRGLMPNHPYRVVVKSVLAEKGKGNGGGGGGISVHFTTRPLPQVPQLPAALQLHTAGFDSAASSAAKAGFPGRDGVPFTVPEVSKQTSPLYSRIGVPTWLK